MRRRERPHQQTHADPGLYSRIPTTPELYIRRMQSGADAGRICRECLLLRRLKIGFNGARF